MDDEPAGTHRSKKTQVASKSRIKTCLPQLGPGDLSASLPGSGTAAASAAIGLAVTAEMGHDKQIED